MARNHQFPFSPRTKTARSCSLWIYALFLAIAFLCDLQFANSVKLLVRGIDSQNEIQYSELYTGLNSSPTLLNDQKPYFVLHVGPGKTGTTSMQCALQSLKNELLRDNFFIYNTQSCSEHNPQDDKRAALWKCLREKHGDPLPACTDFYLSDFRNVTKSGNVPLSIIISNEMLYPVTRMFSRFVERLNEEYQVVIIATYRHVFEYTVSYYSQHYKHLDQWPDDSASSTDDILSFIRQRVANHKIDPFKQLTAGNLSAYSSFRPLNFHASPLVHNFICHGLPEAPSACRKIQTQSKTEVVNVGTASYMFDSIAVEARKNLLLPKTLGRQATSNMLAKSFKVVDWKRLPLICLSEAEIAEFWDATKRTAREVSKYNMVDGSTIDLKDLLAEFNKAWTSGLWCRIDASKLFEDKMWRMRVTWYTKHLAFRPLDTVSKKTTPFLLDHQKQHFVLKAKRRRHSSVYSNR